MNVEQRSQDLETRRSGPKIEIEVSHLGDSIIKPSVPEDNAWKESKQRWHMHKEHRPSSVGFECCEKQ